MEVQGYNLPDDLYYDENQFWVRVEGDEVVIGMTDFAQKLADEIVYVQLPEDGKKCKKGKKLAKVESGKWLGKVISPVDGELVEVNEELEINPGLINEDPYGEGWMYRIKADDISQVEGLIHGDAVKAWMEAEIVKHSEQ